MKYSYSNYDYVLEESIYRSQTIDKSAALAENQNLNQNEFDKISEKYIEEQDEQSTAALVQ